MIYRIKKWFSKQYCKYKFSRMKIYKIGDKDAYIKLSEVPEPFRTACKKTLIGRNCPGVGTMWKWDWERFIAQYIS